MSIAIRIVIDVTGEPQGVPGVAREFSYEHLDPPPLVTLSLEDTRLVTSYSWAFIDIPEGSSAELSDSSVAEPTFTPDEVGTYLVQCTVNGGGGWARNAIAFSTENYGLRIPAAGETTEFDPISGWKEALSRSITALDSVQDQLVRELAHDVGLYQYTQAGSPVEEIIGWFILDLSGLPGVVEARVLFDPTFGVAGSAFCRIYDHGPPDAMETPVQVTYDTGPFSLRTSDSGLQYLETEAFAIYPEPIPPVIPGMGSLVGDRRLYSVRIFQQSQAGDTVDVGFAGMHQKFQ